jgi:hypothetical protein
MGRRHGKVAETNVAVGKKRTYDCVVDSETEMPARSGRGLQYPFDILEVGHSLFFEGRTTPVNIQNANTKLAPMHFTCRVMDDGVRVFRTE